MEEKEFIQAITNEPEGEQMAFFPDFSNEEIVRTVCAFLNTRGGRIMIGIVGGGQFHHIDNFESSFHQLRRFIYDQIAPQSLISIRKETFNNNNFALIEIIEGNRKPYSVDNRSYVRHSNKTVPAEGNDMSDIIRSVRQDQYSWEKLTVMDATMETLNTDLVKETILHANELERSSRFEQNETARFLDHYNLVRNNQVKNSAIVLYGKEPTYFIPQCRLRLIVFEESKTSNQYKDTLLVNQNLFVTYHTIKDYFKRNTPVISEFKNDEWVRNDRRKFPLKALDEAVINALMHRDYSDPTGEVFIGVYPDRIEFINRGKLPLTDKELKKKHDSKPPNPDITLIVYLDGIIEKVGRGTILITEEFEKLGLKSPTWESKSGTVTLTLYGTPKEVELNERMIRFLKTVTPGQQFSREDYQHFFEENEISERTARNDISKMADGLWITKTGEAASTHYTRSEQKLPEAAG